MAQPKMQQEPSMEEILASIRRIIDSGDEAGRELERQRHLPQDDEPQAYSPEPQHSAENGQSRVQDEQEDRLTAVPRAAEPAAEGYGDAGPRDWARPAPVVVNRGDDMAWRGTRSEPAIHPASIGEVAAEVRAATEREMSEETNNPEPVIVANETVAEPAAAPEPVEMAIERPAETPSVSEHLVSLDAEKRVGDALRELSRALKREGSRTVDEIVTAELRPLLSDWLDRNMPPLVERLVAEEIRRMREGLED
ncbi:DUF2497 domain-containing protein [Martelella alba]|uniref:DUF2497 domain-containing protein n=1 Tax=Martelella alba TaxID=2590451 RepID=A0A506UI40_9HYPH|nr:DUF2497 domain-containing protein [Martelella alba]TPW32994.1 DUF2497 domain-containing protein [Martelella alba]